MAHNEQAAVRPTKWGVAALFGLIGAIVVALVVMAFVWPTATAQPQNLPVGISGPDEAVSAIEEVLAEQDPSPLALESVDARDDAVQRIEQRELYGAILLGDEPEVLLASAASPAAAQALRGIAAQLQTRIDDTAQEALTAQLTAIVGALQSGQAPQLPPSAGGGIPEIPTVTVTDVVPLADGDPTGAGIGASLFPLVLGGMLSGILLTLLVQGVIRRLVGLAVFGLAAGALIVLVMQTWFGILVGDWLLNAAVVATSVTATGAFVIAMAALIGRPGVGVAAAFTMLVANPIASAAIPVQFLPEPWGAVGQWLIPGASATLLRSTSYFPETATLTQWLILATWIAASLVVALIGHRRTAAELAPAPAPERASEPAAPVAV